MPPDANPDRASDRQPGVELSPVAEAMPRAIVFADIAGFSEMMGRDEPATLEFMSTCSTMVQDLGARFGGDLVQTTGDGYLMIFGATRSALDFGIELHRVISKRQSGGRMQVRFRVGIHFGDVHALNNSIYGHAVNIAARVQEQAEPGTCLLSRRAYEDLLDAPGYRFEWFGNPPLKNIHEDISLYRVLAATGGDVAAAPALVTVIGSLTLQYDGDDVRFHPSSKVSGLFAYLLLGDGIRHRRDKLASLLWPEGGAVPRNGLSYCRRRLFELCPERLKAAFDFGDSHIGLNELYFETELEIIAKELERGRVPSVLIEMPGWPDAILEGFERVGPVFAGWLRVLRESWRTRILAALSQLLARTAEDQKLCGDAAQAILAIDPGNEPASAKLIRYLAGRGDRIAALDEFTRLEAYLRAHHGLSPGEAVQAAARRAQSRDAASARNESLPARLRAMPSSRLLRISVEPFEGAEPEDGHLVDGFRSDLLANLARFREWSVIDGARSLPNGGDADGSAQYLVSALYMPIPGEGCLRLSLRHRASDSIVWSDDLAVNLADWTGLQRSVVGRIAAHLETYISADRLRHIIGTGAQNAGSHDAWLRAEQIFARWTPASAEEAEAILMRIIEADQAFAPAYSSLAGIQNVRHVIRPGLARDADGERRAHEFAERAVEIDPLDARNQLALAWTAAMTGAFDRAAIHLDLAAELNPNCASTLVSCAMAYAFTGQPAKAETLVAHAQRISPMLGDYQWCYVAAVHFLAGRLEDALHAAQRSGDRIVDNPGWTAATLVRLTRPKEARAEFQRLISAVTPAWAGDGPPSAEAVLDWFVNAYPLRLDIDRQMLREALAGAMRGA